MPKAPVIHGHDEERRAARVRCGTGASGRGGYTVDVSELPGCVSGSDTREAALAAIKEAIEGYLDSLEAHGDPIPRADIERSQGPRYAPADSHAGRGNPNTSSMSRSAVVRAPSTQP
jgi:predicted RNase H-like HicB family nuclease